MNAKAKLVTDALDASASYLGAVSRLSQVVVSTRTAKEREACSAEETRVKTLLLAQRKAAMAAARKPAGKAPSLAAPATDEGRPPKNFWEYKFDAHAPIVEVDGSSQQQL